MIVQHKDVKIKSVLMVHIILILKITEIGHVFMCTASELRKYNIYIFIYTILIVITTIL